MLNLFKRKKEEKKKTLLEEAKDALLKEHKRRIRENRETVFGHDFGSIRYYLTKHGYVQEALVHPRVQEEAKRYYEEQGFEVDIIERPGFVYNHINVYVGRCNEFTT